MEIIKKLSKNFNNIKILNPEISFLNIKKNIDYVLTTYGSVGHELPLLGINVINADKYNPHCSFNFNLNPQNLNEYRKLLLNLDKRPSRLKFKNDIYKFYYIHHFYLKDFNLFFKSQSDYNAFNKSKKYSEIVDIYLNNIYVKKKKKFTIK